MISECAHVLTESVPYYVLTFFLLFRTDVEKLEANQMIVEVDQGVAYVQFEKKLNIRSHIQFIPTLWPKEWSLRKGMTEFCLETS